MPVGKNVCSGGSRALLVFKGTRDTADAARARSRLENRESRCRSRRQDLPAHAHERGGRRSYERVAGAPDDVIGAEEGSIRRAGKKGGESDRCWPGKARATVLAVATFFLFTMTREDMQGMQWAVLASVGGY